MLDTLDGGSSGYKRRRVDRACDGCRRRKVKCDGDQNPTARCTGCAANNLNCTYDEPSLRRLPPKGYIQILEDKIRLLEQFLQHLLPGKDLAEELKEFMRFRRFPQATDDSPFSLSASPKTQPLHFPDGSSKVPNRDEDYLTTLDTAMNNLDIGKHSNDPIAATVRYFGSSSTAMLVVKAMELKRRSNEGRETARPYYAYMRPELWTTEPWEWEAGESRHNESFIFPPSHIMPLLVDKYFDHMNLYLPVLHRPTFERLLYNEHLHLRDEGFASTVLVVCAIGEKRIDAQVDVKIDKLKGWAFFSQVQDRRQNYLSLPTIFDLQFHALSAIFLSLSSTVYPNACWNTLGAGIRFAADVGAHRRWKNQAARHTSEYESYKRVMWVLFCLDHWLSAMMGRPVALHVEDLDIDLPVDCDDEWWNHPDPNKDWVQPEGSPSKLAMFNAFISLTQLLSRCIQTNYTSNKATDDSDSEKREQAILDLDSSLNQWFDSMPLHLRWNSEESSLKEGTFVGQCAFLNSYYHYLQILVHRPHISDPLKQGLGFRSQSAIPSMTICTNAARRTQRILNAFCDRKGSEVGWLPPHTEHTLFVSGLILLFGVWTEGNKRNIEDVKQCMKTIRLAELRSRTIGKSWDLLNYLAHIEPQTTALSSQDPFLPQQHSSQSSTDTTHPMNDPLTQSGYTIEMPHDFSLSDPYSFHTMPTSAPSLNSSTDLPDLFSGLDHPDIWDMSGNQQMDDWTDAYYHGFVGHGDSI